MSEGGIVTYPGYKASGSVDERRRARTEKQGILNGKGVKAKLDATKIGQREMDYAIHITEEKLKVLKGVVEKGKDGGQKREGEYGKTVEQRDREIEELTRQLKAEFEKLDQHLEDRSSSNEL